jgi:LacI family transcriptional regulator
MNLEKIARLAGVSRSTVSRVINKHPYVSDDVRQRVEQVIAREGFQPNAAARALVRQKTEVIGVILPEGLEGLFSSGYFPILLGGISTAISRTDYAMSLWAGQTTEDTQRMYERILGYKLMDGALLISAVNGDTLSQQLIEKKMPVVLIGRVSHPLVSTVDVDNVSAGRTATEHLMRIGRHRIAHIGGRFDLISAHERHEGYKMALEASGIPYDPALVVWGDFSEEAGYLAARALIGQGIDAVFCANDSMAIGLMHALRDQGISVPGDVAIIGFDDLPIASSIIPTLSTMRQPVADLGRTAAQLLLDIVMGVITSPQHIMLPTELIIRESCGTLGNY